MIKTDKIGEIRYNNDNCQMKIVEYNYSSDIVVEFQDDYKAKVRSSYDHFKCGKIRNPHYRMGEKNYNKQNCLMKIVEYYDSHDIVIEFQDVYKSKVHTSYNKFKDGGVKNPYSPNVYGVGYIGNYICETGTNIAKTNQYNVWRNMLKRCYDKEFHKIQSTYEDCTVCEEWHNFQNFAKWYDENYYTIDNEISCLDKDVLVKHNKIYGPSTCIFVPKKINQLFTKRQKSRGKYPIGVSFDIKRMKYKAISTEYNKTNNIGYYKTSEDAFQAYKNAKEDYIKQVANDYMGKIPQKLYNAMYEYEVEITD